MAARAAAAVKVFVLARAGAAHSALGVTADVDVGHGGCVRVARGGAAFRARARVFRQAGCWVAVCGSGITLFLFGLVFLLMFCFLRLSSVNK